MAVMFRAIPERAEVINEADVVSATVSLSPAAQREETGAALLARKDSRQGSADKNCLATVGDGH